MGHSAEADGIEEYDNPLPDWWLGLFWICILWAIGYTVHYHFIADRSQEAGFEAEMAAAAAMWPAEAAAEAAFALTPEAIAAGEAVYATNCFVCHGQRLEGGIGPTFLDEEWLHGGTPPEVIRTITIGVPEKGMVPWGPILSSEQINQVAAFILARYAEATGRTLDEDGSPGGGEAPGTQQGGGTAGAQGNR
jgi:cytochrome c oxidase cbb3-type subunit 3